MDMSEVYRARANERAFERRNDRARRSKRFGAVLVGLTGIGLTTSLLMFPGMASHVVEWSVGTDVPYALRSSETAQDIRVRTMPGDAVPVRRGSERLP